MLLQPHVANVLICDFVCRRNSVYFVHDNGRWQLPCRRGGMVGHMHYATRKLMVVWRTASMRGSTQIPHEKNAAQPTRAPHTAFLTKFGQSSIFTLLPFSHMHQLVGTSSKPPRRGRAFPPFRVVGG